MKELGYTKIQFKKNNGKWHDLDQLKYCYKEPHKIKEITCSYSEVIDSNFVAWFSKTRDSLFPWGKECLYWSNLLEDEFEYIYQQDIVTFRMTWVAYEDITFGQLMESMMVNDFIDYCKDKGIVITVNGAK